MEVHATLYSLAWEFHGMGKFMAFYFVVEHAVGT